MATQWGTNINYNFTKRIYGISIYTRERALLLFMFLKKKDRAHYLCDIQKKEINKKSLYIIIKGQDKNNTRDIKASHTPYSIYLYKRTITTCFI